MNEQILQKPPACVCVHSSYSPTITKVRVTATINNLAIVSCITCLLGHALLTLLVQFLTVTSASCIHHMFLQTRWQLPTYTTLKNNFNKISVSYLINSLYKVT